MKKIIIISAIILTSGLTALSISKKDNKIEAIKTKIDKADFAVKTIEGPKSDLGTAD